MLLKIFFSRLGVCALQFVVFNLQKDFGWNHTEHNQVTWAVGYSIFSTCEVFQVLESLDNQAVAWKTIHPSASHSSGCHEGVCSALPALHIHLLCCCESLDSVLLEWKWALDFKGYMKSCFWTHQVHTLKPHWFKRSSVRKTRKAGLCCQVQAHRIQCNSLGTIQLFEMLILAEYVLW